MITQVPMPFASRTWWVVKRNDVRGRWLADRHYSRQTPGADEFLGSGETLVMTTTCGRAVWGVIKNRVPNGPELRWRCAIFRNEGAGLSSALIVEATSLTYDYWRLHYGALPPVALTTEVDPAKVRRKRDPGRCFLRAGWRRIREHRRLIVFEAPDAELRCHRTRRSGGQP